MQSFTVGQEVAILDYEDRKTGRQTYEVGFFFKGRFSKNPSFSRYSRYSSQTEYISDDRGRYVFVQKADRSWDCNQCNGTGFVFPDGFDPEGKTEAHVAYYRQRCTAWHCINGRCSEPGRGKFIIDRKDKVMSMTDYAPVLEAKLEAADRQRQANIQRERRINGRIQELVDFLPTLLTAEDKELALAKFLKEGGRLAELADSAYRVIEARRPRCTHEGCTKPGEGFSNGMCYQHYNEAREAEEEGESVVA